MFQNSYRGIAGVLLLAVCVRIIIAVGIAHYTHDEGLFLDARSYDRVGWEIAQTWRTGKVVDPVMLGGTDQYSYWVGGVYRVFGHHPFLPQAKNIIFGTLLVFFVFRLTQALFDHRTALCAAVITALYPSLAVWSGSILKDTTMTSAAYMALCYAGIVHMTGQWKKLFFVVIGVSVVFSLRDYLGLFLGASIAISFIPYWLRIKQLPVRLRWCVGIAAIFVGIFALYKVKHLFSAFCPETLHWFDGYRYKLAIGATAIEPDIDISTLPKALAFLPRGLLYFYGAPAPWWPAITLFQKMVRPEQMVWYGLLPSSIYGIWLVIKDRTTRLSGMMLVLYLMFLSVTYGLLDGNLGTMYRHKASIIPGIIIFAAGGMMRCSIKIKKTREPDLHECTIA